MAEKSEKYVITGEVRTSFLNAFEPRADDNGDLKYSTMILIPKSDEKTLSKIKKAKEAVIEEFFKGKEPKKLNYILKDGDEEDLEGEHYEGHYFMNIKSDQKPGIRDASNTVDITDPSAFKSGDYCRVSMRAFGYEKKGKKGISFGLNNFQFLRQGESLGGNPRAADEFEAVAVEDDEDDFL